MIYTVKQGDYIEMKPKKETMYPIMIRMPKRIVDQAKKIGKKELRPFTSVLRRAIIEWLEAYKKRGGK
jgi:hypothetical protein